MLCFTKNLFYVCNDQDTESLVCEVSSKVLQAHGATLTPEAVKVTSLRVTPSDFVKDQLQFM